MRILVFCDEQLSVPGGGPRQVIELSRALAGRGHRVQVIAPAFGESAGTRPELGEVTMRPVRVLPGPGMRPLSYLVGSGLECVRAIRQWQPDVLLWFDSPGQMAPLWSSRSTGCPYVWFVNGLPQEEVCGIWSWSPIVSLLRWTARRAAQRAEAVIGVCEELLGYVTRTWGVPPARCRLIRNGVDASMFRPIRMREARQALGLDQDGHYVGFVGGFFPWHGLDMLVKAVPTVVEQVPQTTCLLVGDGPTRSAMEALAGQLGIQSSVRFPGRVAYETVPTWIAACDVCVVLYRATRSYPGDSMKLWEYLACGRPVVATAGPGYGDVVSKAGCGVAARPEDPDDLARSLTSLLLDQDTRLTMGTRGRAAVVTAHTWAARAVELERVLLDVATESHRGAGSRVLST